ncbi:phosphoribosyltransferase [uncultured Jatrophihabitans sp.]|uniref:phosphoribosyltransferase n=1 Tax=uncultured Jatrophihabitans sp. TaxID=1610747 RepID=UPI0035CB15C6
MSASTASQRPREPYADRHAAGDALAAALTDYAGRDDVVVLGLPRGGVPVAARVATALRAPLDVLVVRKIAAPVQRELAMGAVAVVGDAVEVVTDGRVVDRVRPTDEQFAQARDDALTELRRRAQVLASRRPVGVAGRTVLVVDDGIATGSTLRAAIACLRNQQPSRVVVAAPIASPRVYADLCAEVDDVVCPWLPDRFVAVGQGYVDFTQTTDDQVLRLLSRGRP